MVTRIQIDKVD